MKTDGEGIDRSPCKRASAGGACRGIRCHRVFELMNVSGIHSDVGAQFITESSCNMTLGCGWNQDTLENAAIPDGSPAKVVTHTDRQGDLLLRVEVIGGPKGHDILISPIQPPLG